MISVSYIYDTVQTLIRKDQKGNSFNISEFNRVIPVANFELYNFYVSRLEVSQETTEELKAFMTLGASVTLTSGKGDLPAYGRMLGKPYIGIIPVNLITNLELADRLGDELTQPTTINPVAILGGLNGTAKQITVYPDTIPSVSINYLSIPVTPILDYYINTNGLYTYLDEDATGISVPTGAVYSDGRVGPITVSSLTKNFAWHEDQVPMILGSLLQKAGVILNDQTAIQYGIARETKEEQQ